MAKKDIITPGQHFPDNDTRTSMSKPLPSLFWKQTVTPLLLVIPILTSFLVPAMALALPPEEPVAVVNGTVIHQADLNCAVEATLVRGFSPQEEKDGNDNPAGDARILHRLIDIELLYQESLKHRFPGLVEEAEERYQLEVRRLGGEEKLHSALLCNDLTPEQFRKIIFRNLSIKRLLDKEVFSRITVAEEDVIDYYETHREKFRKPESVRLRQIFIKARMENREEGWREAENRAREIYQSALTGLDFVNLARRFSEDPASAGVGGDLGLIEKGNLQSPFGTFVFTLQSGTITEPLRSRNGFHILKIVSSHPPEIMTLEEAREQIITRIRKKRAKGLVSELLKGLRSSADIQVLGKESSEKEK